MLLNLKNDSRPSVGKLWSWRATLLFQVKEGLLDIFMAIAHKLAPEKAFSDFVAKSAGITIIFSDILAQGKCHWIADLLFYSLEYLLRLC